MNTKAIVKTYAFATLFCIVFHAVYALFGHGVSSPYMTYAFVFSLVLGVAGSVVLGQLHVHDRTAFHLYNAGVATLTVGSVLRGIIDIAGADTTYPVYYFVVGTILVVVGTLMYLCQWVQTHRPLHMS
jgi:hypothetical protein